jgi:hypothetical protein
MTADHFTARMAGTRTTSAIAFRHEWCIGYFIRRVGEQIKIQFIALNFAKFGGY